MHKYYIVWLNIKLQVLTVVLATVTIKMSAEKIREILKWEVAKYFVFQNNTVRRTLPAIPINPRRQL